MTAEITEPSTTPTHRRGVWPKAIPLLVLAGLLAYSNSFTKAFILDDMLWITGHPDIHNASQYMKGASRPVMQASILLNHRLGGFNPTGYHALNLAVHILAGLTLYGLVRRVLLQPRFAGRYNDTAPYLAFAIALLWLVHPLQTQAVTYIIQRCESMMGLFFLFTFYAWLRGATGGSLFWYLLAVVSYLLSAWSKEVAVTLPPLLLLFDRIFLATSWREIVRKRWSPYLAILAIWAMMLAPAVRTAQSEGTSSGVGFEIQSATPVQYLMTESGVILHYLRLSFWPVGQALDYLDWPIAKSISDVWPQFVVVTGLFLTSVVLLFLRPAAGFVGFWFFAILAPTSSIMPIIDPAFEHRMYLSLASVAVAVVFGAHAVLQATGWPERQQVIVAGSSLTLATIALIALTFARNETYNTGVSANENAAAARPNNTRPITALAAHYLNSGEYDKADYFIMKAEAIPDPYGLSSRQRAPWLMVTGRLAEGETMLQEVISHSVFHHHGGPNMYKNLTWTRIALGNYDSAVNSIQELIKYQPSVADNQLTLAAALLAAGREEEARTAAAEAVRLAPDIAIRSAREARAYAVAPESPSSPFFLPRAQWTAAAACLADGDRDPFILDTLALAYSRNGRYAEAADATRRGIAAAEAKGDSEWVAALQTRLKFYEAGKPYRKPS